MNIDVPNEVRMSHIQMPFKNLLRKHQMLLLYPQIPSIFQSFQGGIVVCSVTFSKIALVVKKRKINDVANF